MIIIRQKEFGVGRSVGKKLRDIYYNNTTDEGFGELVKTAKDRNIDLLEGSTSGSYSGVTFGELKKIIGKEEEKLSPTEVRKLARGYMKGKNSTDELIHLKRGTKDSTTLAHELGHSEHWNGRNKNFITNFNAQLEHKLRGSKVVKHAGVGNLAAGFISGYRSGDKEKDTTVNKLLPYLPGAVVNAPTLIEEADASRRGLRLLKKAGVSKTGLKKSKKSLCRCIWNLSCKTSCTGWYGGSGQAGWKISIQNNEQRRISNEERTIITFSCRRYGLPFDVEQENKIENVMIEVIRKNNISENSLKFIYQFNDLILIPSFPDSNEREDINDIVARIYSGWTECAIYVESNEVLGGIIIDTYAKIESVEIIYIATSPEHRGEGIGKRLLDWVRKEYGGWNIFLEVDIPNSSCPFSYTRRKIWKDWGAKEIPIRYIQPPLSSEKECVSGNESYDIR